MPLTDVDDTDSPIPCWRTPQPAPNSHQDHEINLIVEGGARYLWRGPDGRVRKSMVTAGDVFIVPGGVRHTIEVDRRLVLDGLWIHPERFPTRVDTGESARTIRDATVYGTLSELFALAKAEVERPDGGSPAALRALGEFTAVTFLRLLSDTGLIGGEPDSGARVAAVRAWIDRHYLENPPLADLARRAGLGVSRFSERFRIQFGMPPVAYVAERRLAHAQWMIEETDLPLREVARACGFPHEANLIRAFRTRYGSTPGQHRKIRQS